jgi:hypothetical protein
MNNFSFAMESLGLAIHKAPIVYDKCWNVWNDTVQFEDTMTYFSDGEIYFRILENTFFNFIDIELSL